MKLGMAQIEIVMDQQTLGQLLYLTIRKWARPAEIQTQVHHSEGFVDF